MERIDNEAYRRMVMQICENKFKNKTELKSAVKPRDVLSAEREYKRLARDVNNEMYQVIKDNLPKIIDIFSRRYAAGQRYDSDEEDLSALERIFDKVRLKFTHGLVYHGLKKRITNIANVRRRLTVQEWKRVCKRTLGVNIMEDYYNGGKFQRLVDEWIENNVNLISTIPMEEFEKMRKLVFDSWYDSVPPKELTKQIQRQWNVTKSRAELIAVDQTLKLNSNITQEQHKDAGVSEYIWYTVGDARVRSDHRVLHGTRQSWDAPPIIDRRYERRGHPGEDYRCRCVAIPIFDKEELNLPIKEVDWNEVDERTRRILIEGRGS